MPSPQWCSLLQCHRFYISVWSGLQNERILVDDFSEKVAVASRKVSLWLQHAQLSEQNVPCPSACHGC